ncbi:MAG: hypothetical protein AMXMBFR58_29300 [Phycisphaerae bacterium]
MAVRQLPIEPADHCLTIRVSGSATHSAFNSLEEDELLLDKDAIEVPECVVRVADHQL